MSNDRKEKKEIALKDKQEIAKREGEPTHAGVAFSPNVDIYETPDAITVVADLPGVQKDKLVVDVKDRVLTITGLADEQEARLEQVYGEYRVGGFSRRFTLGDDVDQSKISATLKDGVLHLALPKADRLKPRKIAVEAK